MQGVLFKITKLKVSSYSGHCITTNNTNCLKKYKPILCVLRAATACRKNKEVLLHQHSFQPSTCNPYNNITANYERVFVYIIFAYQQAKIYASVGLKLCFSLFIKHRVAHEGRLKAENLSYLLARAVGFVI